MDSLGVEFDFGPKQTGRSRSKSAGRAQEPSRAEPSAAEPSKRAPSRAKQTPAEPSAAEPSRAEPSAAEPSRAEPSRAETIQAATILVGPSQGNPSANRSRSRSVGKQQEPSQAEPSVQVPPSNGPSAKRSRTPSAARTQAGRKRSNASPSAEEKQDESDAAAAPSETVRKADEILGAAARAAVAPVEEHAAKSSYAFETTVPEVAQTLKTYRVQIDYGKRDRMTRGYTSYYMPLMANIDASTTERPAIYAMLPLLTQGTTAPQMPPPKINDPNMQFNWSHLIDEWPLKSKRPCSNCMHPFESIPWMIPIKRIEGYYKMDDSEHVFCSYPCMRRFLISSGYPDRFMCLVYANDIARNYFCWKGDLLSAPLRIWLETMSIDEYRSHLCPPPFFEFPRHKSPGEPFDPRIESRWMSDMTMLRPPFLSGTAIMEWVQNVVPRAQQASKVLYDSS
jgi:hypothetical protein